MAAGGLAAALSTADGLLLAIANALSHDVYYKMIDKNAPPERRMLIARILLILVAILAAWYASTSPADIGTLVAWAFSMAAAGFFPALVLGIWWKRTTSLGAITGLASGFMLCIYYMFGSHYDAADFYQTWSGLSNASAAQIMRFNELMAAVNAAAPGAAKVAAETALNTHARAMANWFGVTNLSSGLFGLTLSFVVTIVVSLLTPAPTAQVQAMIDRIRQPRGASEMA